MLIDKKFWTDDGLIGCDEVGRGPIAGPVVAASCYIKSQSAFIILKKMGITDSKKLSAKKRKDILLSLGIDVKKLKVNKKYSILGGHVDFVLGSSSAQEIDELNILQAALLAMRTSAKKLYPKTLSPCILVDGNFTLQKYEKKKLKYPMQAIVKGDSKSLAIGLASIIAKEFRDETMTALSLLYPLHGLEKHAGYPTKSHLMAIKEWGVLPIHRKTFKGVKEHVEKTQGQSF